MKVYWYWPFAKAEELSLAAAVARRGVDLVVHTLPRAAVEGPDGYRLLATLPEVPRRFRPPSPRWLMSRFRVYGQRAKERRQAIRRESPDVSHVFFVNRFTDGLGGLGEALPGRTVLNVHDLDPHVGRLGGIDGWLLRRAYRHAGALVVHHAELARQLAGRGISARRIVVIPHPVYYEHTEAPRPDRRGIRLLFFGSFRPNKGLDVLLEAARRLERDPTVRFHVAGRGDRGLEERVAAAGTESSNVDADVGWQAFEDKTRAFVEADAVVLPYTSFSSQSGVLHDAYGFGRPVIGTNVGALGTSIRQDETGWVVPAGDAGALVEQILRLRDDPKLLRRAQASVLEVRRTRNVEFVADRLVELYRSMMCPYSAADLPAACLPEC